MNFALRPVRWPFTLEKWYIDTLLPDGTVLLVYLARMVLSGVSVSRATVELFRPELPPLRADARVRHLGGGEGWMQFGPVRLEGERLSFKMPGLSGNLLYVPRLAPVTLLDPFLTDGRHKLTWEVELPDADVQGHLEWPGGGLELQGRGYRDRVYFDYHPWRFPIRRLTWGRAVAGPHACTWVEAETPTGLVEAGLWNGVPGAALKPRLGPPRILIESAILDLENLRLGTLRPLLRRLSADPRETKWQASAHLEETEGQAIHEVVTWG